MPKTENEQAGPGEDERPSKKQATEPATAAGDGGKEKGANGSSAHRNPTVEANLKEALAGEDKSLYNYHMPAGEKGASDVTKTFNRDGVVVVPGFCSAEEVAGMKKRMQVAPPSSPDAFGISGVELIDAWDPSESKGSVFHTYGNKHINTNYFLDSAATTKFFLEPGAVDEKGEIRSDIPKGELINKVASHCLALAFPMQRTALKQAMLAGGARASLPRPGLHGIRPVREGEEPGPRSRLRRPCAAAEHVHFQARQDRRGGALCSARGLAHRGRLLSSSFSFLSQTRTSRFSAESRAPCALLGGAVRRAAARR
eukprot:1346643-Rhodomonas_salina.2